MKKQIKLMFLASMVLLFTACKDDENKIKEGQIVFSFEDASSKNKGGRTEADATDIAYAMVSIQNEAGELVKNREILNVSAFGNGFITTPLTMLTGGYELTEFLLLDAANNVLFATPIAGSDLAYLVQNPLAIPFTINNNVTTQLSPEVVDVTASVPDQYGYAGFTFTVIETINVMLSVLALDQNTGIYNSTAYDLAIANNGTTVVNKAMPAQVNTIKLRSDLGAYTITVTLDPDNTFTQTYTVSELAMHATATQNPLQITFGGGGNLDLSCSQASDCPAGYNCEAGICTPDGTTEICGDGIDNNNDGTIDEGCASDMDGDGFTTADGDCDDSNDTVYPGATDIPYDGIDQNCDGLSDYDQDGDGHDSASFGGGDCDDSNDTVYPGATEIMDGLDNDCDGQIDEDFGCAADGDCPTGYICNANQCEAVPSEICGDGIDNDMDGDIDEGCSTGEEGSSCSVDTECGTGLSCVSGICQYLDQDGDGFTVGNGDCDDNNAQLHPNTEWYIDNDGDGYGSMNQIIVQCTQPTAYVLDNTDCDDDDASTYPGAPEVTDGTDNNCNGVVDEP